MIASLAKFAGLNTIVVWLLVIGVGFGAIWTHGQYRYSVGYNAGAKAEEATWKAAMADLEAKLEEERRESQRRIDTIERDYLDAERRVIEAERKAQNAMEDAISEMEEQDKGQPPRAVLPKSLVDQLNRIGR